MFIKYLNALKVENNLYAKCKFKLTMDKKQPLHKFNPENVNSEFLNIT